MLIWAAFNRPSISLLTGGRVSGCWIEPLHRNTTTGTWTTFKGHELRGKLTRSGDSSTWLGTLQDLNWRERRQSQLLGQAQAQELALVQANQSWHNRHNTPHERNRGTHKTKHTHPIPRGQLQARGPASVWLT